MQHLSSALSKTIVPGFFILLWIYAASSKLMDLEEFKIQLGQSPLLTSFYAWAAWMVPLTEILIACFLVVPSSRRMGLWASAFLMSAFTTYIFILLYSGLDIPCSCGGILGKMSWEAHLAFNAGCLALCIVGMYFFERESS